MTIKNWRYRLKYLVIAIAGGAINGLCQYGIFTFAIHDTSNAVLFRKMISMIGYLIAEPLACFGLFGLFSTLSLKRNKMINMIASHTFGVYLFHEAPAMRTLLWSQLRPDQYYGKSFYFLHVAVCVLAVFIVASFTDVIREVLFQKTGEQLANRAIEAFKRIGFSGQD